MSAATQQASNPILPILALYISQPLTANHTCKPITYSSFSSNVVIREYSVHRLSVQLDLKLDTYYLSSEGAVIGLVLETNGFGRGVRLAFFVFGVSHHENLP